MKKTHAIVILSATVLSSSVALGYGKLEGKTVKSVIGIPFVSYGQSYQTKIDFAFLDHAVPIPVEVLTRIKPSDLAQLDQEQWDQLYARLSSGPMPDGPYEGAVFTPEGGPMLTGGAYVNLDKVPQVARKFVEKVMNETLKEGLFRKFAETLWKGKSFSPAEGVVRNQIPATIATVFVPFGLDIDKVTGGIKNTVTSWLKKVTGNNEPANKGALLFPAKLYCGQSLFDSRRESIILDYSYNVDIPGYDAVPDSWVGVDAFNVRDELRMVRPGFYIGKAYANRIALLNFSLYQPAIAENPSLAVKGSAQDACWSGTQARKSSLARASENFFDAGN